MDRPLRLSSVMAVARILLCTVPPNEVVSVLVGQYGWDAAFQSLALLRGVPAERAFAVAWQELLLAPIGDSLTWPIDLPPAA